MFKTVLLIMLTCAVALGGGAASVAYVLNTKIGFDEVRSGPWRSSPNFGTRDADPYSKAEAAIDGMLSLGRAEGAAFFAERDSTGEFLDASCAYQLKGEPPAGRFWTLRAEPLAANSGTSSPAAIHSREMLRKSDNSVEIAIARMPFPGNWLPLTATGRMRLVLTVYDPPASSGWATDNFEMPSVNRIVCDA